MEGQADANSRPDLDPNNTANFARVAPSSRPHTETFTRDEIDDLEPSNVYDLLSHATGLVPTYQGRKLAYTINMRGDSNYAFIIDGAYVPTETAGRVLQTLPVSAIEQVDIVRDATALTLGPLVNLSSASGALNSGFIVIRTHSPSKTEGEVRGAVESYGTLTSSGYAGTAWSDGLNEPRAYISGLVSQSRTDGPAGYNSWSEATTGLLKLGYTTGILETNFEAFQDHARYGFERGVPGQSSSIISDQRWSYAPIDTTLLTSNSIVRWDTHNSTLLTLSYNSVSAENVQASYVNNSVNTNADKTSTVNANLRHSFEFDHTLLQIGAEYLYYNTPTGEAAHAGFADEEQTFSGYFHGEQKLFDDRLTLDAAARIDDHEIIQGVDSYGGGSGSGAVNQLTPRTTTTTNGGTTTTTTVNGNTTTVVTATTTVTKLPGIRPTSGPGSGTGGGPGSPGAGTGMGNPYQFYIYPTVTTTNYTTTTTTNGVTTTATGQSVTTVNTRQTPPLNQTTTTISGTVPAGVAAGSSSTGTTGNTTASLPYFYNRWFPLAKSFSGGAALKILPQLLATARFSHTEQGGLANVISASGQPLDPESQTKWEVGLVAPLSAAFKPGFNLFNIKIDNDKVPTSYQTVNEYQVPLWSETNTQRFGFELLGEGALTASEALGQTGYRASWMHLMSVKSSTIAAYPTSISHDVVNGTLIQKWQDYSFTVALNYVAPYQSNFNSYDGGYHSVGNFVTVNLSLGHSFKFDDTTATLTVYGRDITNRKSETVYGFPSWGAVWGSELVLKF